MKEIGILGAGSWGTALAVTLAKKGFNVKLWCRDQGQAVQLVKTRENIKYLPGVVLPHNINVSINIEEVLANTSYIVFAVPSHAIREILGQIKSLIIPEMILINTAKGIEPNTLMRLSEVFEDEIPGIKSRFSVLSGPSHAEEVGRDMPTAVVAASTKREVAEKVQDIFMTPKFRVYTNPDVVGVEIGGAMKNVIALATGIADGLGYGDNTKAALITRGMTEIARLGVKMGANPLTFAGLTGIGDLVVTCTSMHSRNRRAGMALGQGKELDTVLEEMGMVVEGVRTTKAAVLLGKKFNVELPIAYEVNNVLFNGITPSEGVVNLMTRIKTHEMEEIVDNQEQW
ncbi:MAG: glycerol-3-phosphate dehydrogenase [Clostridia bacterium]|jgi:glycerol-3-phosphate dehydrogenase (NAD(P)+)|nr:glycerol-3-phosphate dehydrogenase [Clostridia bacterium]MDN5322876.1 glycerol-3-phosphate dehydrogenase [Clostridia bacterium]